MPALLTKSVPQAVVTRFPHLRDRLASRVEGDEEFLNLCEDYAAVVVSLKRLVGKDSDGREELVCLKNSLEVEILERLSR